MLSTSSYEERQQMIILGLLHIWILGALPLLAVSAGLFNRHFTQLCRAHGLGDWTALVIWAGIISLFYIIACCFSVGSLYLSRQADSPLGSWRRTIDYLLMTIGPMLYWLIIHLLAPGLLFDELVEAGVIALISQHTTLHLVLLVTLLRTAAPRPKLSLAAHGAGSLIFIVVSASLYLIFLGTEPRPLWLALFHISLASSTIGSARFFYRCRFRLLAAAAE